MADEIATKCVCIIRHQKGLKNPKIYEVDIEIRGDKIYNFNKGKEIKENVEEVIAERNQLIANKKEGIYDYSKYFFIIEYDIPFFRGEFEKYADLFEFMDVPGLNEDDENNGKQKNSSKEEDKNFYFKRIFPIISMNIKFALFIFDAQGYESNNTYDILNNYLYGGNIESFKNQVNQLEKENREYTIKESFKESVFILNKIDFLSKDKDKREDEHNTFKNNIELNVKNNNNLNIKLNEENEIGINGRLLNESISKLDSFEDYLHYYISNSKEFVEDINLTFYNYISNKMNQDFKLKLDEEEDEEDSEDEDNENFPSKMKKEEIKLYKGFKEEVNRIDFFVKFISPKKYYQLKKVFKKNIKNYNKKEEEKCLENIIKKKMEKIIKDYFNIDYYTGMVSQIQSELNIDPNKNNKMKILQRLAKMNKNLSGIGDPKQVIHDFGIKINKIYNFDTSNETAIKLKNNYNVEENYFNNTSAIRYLLIGPHNSGKSSFLNNIIGYDLLLLPMEMKECTKVGVIIKYTEKKEDIKLLRTYFRTNEKGKNYFEYDENYKYNIIAEGEKNVYQKLNELNHSNVNNSNLDFYLLKTPIEFFDSMKLPKELKEKIELIDFPGLDTNFKQAQEKAKNLLKIIDGFIFIYYTVKYSKDEKDIFRLVYQTIKERPQFSFETCLFILNKIDTLKEINLEKEKETILEIFDQDNKFEDSGDVIERSKRIGDKTLIISKFSCMRYKEYKDFSSKLLNFEEFINSHNKKENTTSIIPLNLFKEENEAKIIESNIRKQNYINIDNKKYEKFQIKQSALNDYLERIKKLNLKNAKEENLKELVKLYFYIMVNQKKSKKYQLSFIEPLLNNFNNVIKKTKDFFLCKQQIYTRDFVIESFKEIMELLFVIKKVMKNENIDQFKNIDRNQIYEQLKREASHVKDNIITNYSNKKAIIDDKIRSLDKSGSDKEKKNHFNNLVDQNKEIIDNLITDINKIKSNFDKYLTEKNEELINKLNLNDLQKEKEEFKNNMKKFETMSLSNISSRSDDYNVTVESKFLFFFTSKSYDINKTIEKYQNSIDSFFNGKDAYLEVIDKNTDKVINDIEGIFSKFNQTIDGFKNHFNAFEDIVKEVETFIYKSFGIRE